MDGKLDEFLTGTILGGTARTEWTNPFKVCDVWDTPARHARAVDGCSGRGISYLYLTSGV
jgi:hypothetical protein